MKLMLFGAALWALCGVVGYGVTYAHFRASFPMLNSRRDIRETQGFATFFGLMGPVGLLVAVMMFGFGMDGLRYRQ